MKFARKKQKEETMIRFENVSKIYPKQNHAALDLVNLEILKG